MYKYSTILLISPIIFKFNFNIQQSEQKRNAAVHLSQQLSRNKSGIIQLYDKQVMVLVYV